LLVSNVSHVFHAIEGVPYVVRTCRRGTGTTSAAYAVVIVWNTPASYSQRDGRQ